MDKKITARSKPYTNAPAHTPQASVITSPAMEDADLKREVLTWILTVCSALFTYLALALLIAAIYHPDVDALRAIAEQNLISPALARPEPMEAMLFRMGVIIVVPSLCLYYMLYTKASFVARMAESSWFNYISVAFTLILAVFICAGFAAHNQSEPGKDRLLPVVTDSPSNNNFNFFFDDFFIGRYFWLYTLLIAPAVAWLFLPGTRKPQWLRSAFLMRFMRLAGYALIAAVLLGIAAMHTFSFPYINYNKFDFNAVYYSMTQVYAGVPMLVDGFTNTYGLYPHILNPLFQLIGLSVLKFSLVMSLLMVSAFVLNFYMLRKFVTNDALLFLGFTTMLFFSFLNRKLQNSFDCFFALSPIRYILPSLLTVMAMRYFLAPSRRKYIISTIVAAGAVLWNPEIGIVCYVAWFIVNLYYDFYTADGAIDGKSMAKHLIVGAVVLPLAFYLYKVLILLFYGAAPDMSLLWSTMAVFSKVGFNLLPMALLHPWNTVALITVAGFIYAFARWYRKAITPRSAIVLMMSVISVGYLAYYQGRSHSVNLSVSSGFSIMLLTLFADDLWRYVNTRRELVFRFLFCLVLYLFSFSFMELVYNTDKMLKYVCQEEDKAIQAEEQQFVESNREFIRSNSSEGDRIMIMSVSKLQGLYFDGDKRRAAFNPGLIDMFLKKDLQRYEHTLVDSSFPVFIEPQVFSYPYVYHAVATLAALYDSRKASKSMVYLEKRKVAVPDRWFLGREPDRVVHRKYSDTKQGLDMRVNDAFGMTKVSLAPRFSVQAVFYTQPQLYPYATVIGNFNSYSGFILADVQGGYYTFAVNNAFNSVQVRLQQHQWQYIAVNVYPDHVDLYSNGRLAASKPLQEPLQQSAELLHVGNMDNPHFFLGAIAEVSVVNRVIDSTQIRQTWDEISRAVNNG